MRRRTIKTTVTVATLVLAAGAASAQCPGDANNNGCVNFADYGAVAANFGQPCSPETQFVDNLDGTITDRSTGLMWEKKVKLDSTTDLANLQDADNVYRWSGTCSVTTSKRCQPDAASEAACLAGVEGNLDGCSQCTGGEGTCTVGSTVWQWLAALNAANYAGHADWRLATKGEYVSIIDDTDTTPPVVNVAFHGASCGVACTDVNDPACSCTRSFSYWSASLYAPSPGSAWDVGFYGGFVNAGGKPGLSLSVRAVRGGS